LYRLYSLSMTYKELKELILKHNHLYYDLYAPEISDAEWDKLYDTLDAMEIAQGWKDYDSPTAKVGGTPGKVNHPHRLYSLKKVYTKEEIDPSFDIVTPKIDGTNLTLVYKRRRLALALTRGNGELGDNVIHLAKHIINIPKSITTEYDLVIVNGECATNKKVENYRNYVSGALGLKNESEFITREIIFVAHDWLGIDLDYTSRMTILKNMGFNTVLEEKAWSYPSDGIVYRINSHVKCKQLGYTAKYPRFAIALKERELETAITTLQDVEWNIGRTGTVNPTAIITPVTIDDATISRLTLHNIGIIEEHNLGLGDLIEIERAGGVIPKFLRVIEHAKHNIKITKTHAENAIGYQTRRDGPKLVLVDNIASNNTKSLEHFVKVMDIKGLGVASIKKLNLQHPKDIYDDIDWDILGANGNKIKQEVERSKSKPYEQVLEALGIPGVGKSAATVIVNKIPAFRNLKDIELVDIKGIGPATKKSVITWFEANENWVLNLPLQLEKALQVEDVLQTKPAKKVCITGKMDMTRNQLAEILANKGFVVTSGVTKDCYALISGGDITSSKYKKALELGVKVVDYWSYRTNVVNGNF
jgi:DNA ligase (NAD+)